MNDTRYSPPSARVADAATAGSLERPEIVSRAVYLLWASFVLIFPSTIYEVTFPEPDISRAEMIGLAIFSVGVSGAISYWLNTAAWKGKGYARWVLAALAVVGFTLIFWLERIMPEIQKLPWYIQSIDLVSYAVAIVGNAMLFAPSANAWYREMRARR